jgi:3-deoxy-D-manno-octulosonic-acid transferase
VSQVIYKAGIFLFGKAITVASLFNPKARLLKKGRSRTFEGLQQAFESNQRPVAWFHCASLGEFEQARPVIESFREQYPDFKILLTFFSPSGFEVRKNYPLADFIVYLPADTAHNATRFVSIVKPAIAFFVKYEFWHFYLKELKAAGVPVISFSAIFRPDQVFFKNWGGFYRKILTNFDHIFVQNKESVKLLADIHITNVTLAGDTRFDRVKTIVDNRKEIKEAAAFKNDQQLLAVGSSWPEDMDVLVPFINNFSSPLKIIIAPHEIHDKQIENLRKRINRKTILFSETTKTDPAEADVLIIDNIGMLSSLYQYAEFAWIGGAFGKGLHNILEAATYGMPVFFGPNFGKFQEANDLIKQGAAFTVSNTNDFETLFNKLYNDEKKLRQVSGIAAAYVKSRTGATQMVLDYVVTLSLNQNKN